MSKSYIMDISSNGAPQFVDPKDRGKYRKVLARLRDSGIDRIVMTIDVYRSGMTSKKQENLFNVVVSMIALESGHDRNEIRHLLLEDFSVAVSDMDNQEFNRLLDKSFEIAREMFNVTLYINEAGNIEQED